MRHELDPTLGETLQHRFMRKHTNVKSEIMWSQIRRRWSPGYEDLLEFGVLNGIYDPDNSVHRYATLYTSAAKLTFSHIYGVDWSFIGYSYPGCNTNSTTSKIGITTRARDGTKTVFFRAEGPRRYLPSLRSSTRSTLR